VRQRRFWLEAVCAVAVVSLLASCSSSSKKSSAGSSGSGTSSAAGNSSATGKTSGSPVEVEAIIVTTGTQPQLDVQSGLIAGEDAINAAGGINGRPFKVIVCNSQNSQSDPTIAEQCARSLISNQSVIASVAEDDCCGNVIDPILNTANVPNIGDLPLTAPQLSTPNSFPLEGPEPAAFGDALYDLGARHIDYAYYGSSEVAATIPLINGAMEVSRHSSLASTIPVPDPFTDLTPQVTQTDKADGVALGLTGDQLDAWLKIVKQLNLHQKLLASAIALQPNVIASLGSLGNGLYEVAGLPVATDTSMPGIAMFDHDMDTYQPKAEKDENSLNAWMSDWAVAQVARSMTQPITRANFYASFRNQNNFNVFGLLPSGFSTVKGPLPIAALSRQLNTDVVVGVLQNGAVQPVKGYLPVYSPPTP
jgi:branched-chain amino acid transport system substrate-binding protein